MCFGLFRVHCISWGITGGEVLDSGQVVGTPMLTSYGYWPEPFRGMLALYEARWFPLRTQHRIFQEYVRQWQERSLQTHQ